ncbi:MAG: cyclohexanone monooxygenase [Frankiales bacterium]|nr:cyclohexanone monooxygenase [Frankiales bacterium]
MTQTQTSSATTQPTAAFDALIVGAGFGGMYALHRFRQLGISVRAVEAGDGVGGTWYWNRYPGARVDVESMTYSFSFSPELEQDWSWSKFYASQEELLIYANHVADRFDLRKDIQFETRVTSARYDEATRRWLIGTDRGDLYSVKYFITAAGCLSATNVPDFKGLESFQGDWYHTSQWPKAGVDLTGKRVGIIGTGSTGIQSIPVIAEQADYLYVFQRTANFSLPSDDSPMDPVREAEWKAKYREHRAAQLVSRAGADVGSIPDRSALDVSPEERDEVYEHFYRQGGFALLQSFNDLGTNLEANETAAEFVRNKIRAIVKDQEVAELLAPKDHPIGTKRICMDTHYYGTYNRDNIKLVDVKTNPIVEITPTGLRTTAGEYEFDVLVLATGFDAMTGPLLRMNIVGKDGIELKDQWAAGPKTYLGLTVAGFPNMFTITGPGSPSVLAVMTVAVEQHVDWIADAISHLEDQELAQMEPSEQAQEAWVEHVNEVADMTLFRHANSWYLGANIEGKARVFMPYIGGFGYYKEKCDEVAAHGYEGFVLSK